MGGLFNEIVHDFNNDLGFEKSTRTPMDNFYRNVWGVKDITIEDYDTETGRVNQRDDRDVLLTTKDGRQISVSEKYRRGRWNDILIEIYSLYPNKLGWAMHSKAKIIAYVRSEQGIVTEINTISLIPVAEQIQRTLDPGLIERLIKSGKNSAKITLFLFGKNIECRLICARNMGYETISVAVPDNELKQMGVKMKDFPLNVGSINEDIGDFTDIL